MINSLLSNFGLSIKRVDKKDAWLYKKHYDEKDLMGKRFYNVGAGLFRHKFWTNIDHYSEHYHRNHIDIDCDLSKKDRLPVMDGSANVVYSSHTIEHLSDESVHFLIGESFRILKKGGYIRLTCPDVELGYMALMNHDDSFYGWETKQYGYCSVEKGLVFSIATSLTDCFSDEEIRKVFCDLPMGKALDFFTDQCSNDGNPGFHVSWWSKDKLMGYLRDAGFSCVYVSGFCQSRCPVLRNPYYFDNTFPRFSLYVEGVK